MSSNGASGDSRPERETFYRSPMDRPSSEKCFKCSKLSGTVNQLQKDWITRQLTRREFPEWVFPTLPKWNRKPLLQEYLLKPLHIYHPEQQLGIAISTLGKCPFCSRFKSLEFKSWTEPRHVHCLEQDAFQVSAR